MGALADFATQTIELITPLVNKSVIALIIIFIGFILGRIVSKFLERALHEIELNKLMKDATGLKISLEEVCEVIVRYFIYFIFIIMALNQIGITTIVLNMITGAIFILIILSIFLGIKDLVPNFIAGLVIHRKGFIKPGDKIKVNTTQGKIQKISLVQTSIKTKKGDIIFIPNSLLTKHKVIKLKK